MTLDAVTLPELSSEIAITLYTLNVSRICLNLWVSCEFHKVHKNTSSGCAGMVHMSVKINA